MFMSCVWPISEKKRSKWMRTLIILFFSHVEGNFMILRWLGTQAHVSELAYPQQEAPSPPCGGYKHVW